MIFPRRTVRFAAPLLAGAIASTAFVGAATADAADATAALQGGWAAGSRVATVSMQTQPLTAADAGTRAVIRLDVPEGASIDCTKLGLVLQDSSGARTVQASDAQASGCYRGAAELHTTLGAIAAGRSLKLTVPVTISSGSRVALKASARTAETTVQRTLDLRQNTTPTTNTATTTSPAATASPTPVAPATPAGAIKAGLPGALTGAPTFHVHPYTQVGTAYRNETDPATKKLYGALANTPTAVWYDGVNSQMRHVVDLLAAAKAKGTVPTIVIYGIPDRDCGLYSAGGHRNAEEYRAWVNQMSQAVGQQKAVVIVEPDAISFCGDARGYTAAQKQAVRAERTALMTHVGVTFEKNNPNAALYIHAGSAQLQQEGAAQAVIDSGIKHMRGFAMNVAGLSDTARNEAWAEQFVKTLAAKGVPNKHYVVDTARSGLDHPSNPGATYNSCNNFNAVPGPTPTTRTTGAHADAYLWIKGAGGSDGAGCHEQIGVKAPAAGTFYPSLAKAVVTNGLKAGSLTLA